MSSFGRLARAVAAFVVVAAVMLDVSSSSATEPTPNADPPITTFSDPGHHLRRPRDIVAGPDGNLWFTADRAQLGRITPGGELTLYRDPDTRALQARTEPAFRA
jgi:streptogramin lyase